MIGNTVLVVEGTTDKNLIQSFLNIEIIVTNGSDVPRETITYLKTISRNKKIVVLTDPDGPGQKIRHKLDQEIDNLFHAYINKSNAIKGKKVGVAQANKETILNALQEALRYEKSNQGNLKTNDLLELGLIGKKGAVHKRSYLNDYFKIGFTNGKQMLKRLNGLNINKEQIEKALHEHE